MVASLIIDPSVTCYQNVAESTTELTKAQKQKELRKQLEQ